MKGAETMATVTQKKNKRFDRMTPAQKRVAIAKDVLKHIRSKWLKPTHGEYFNVPGVRSFYPDGQDVRAIIKSFSSCRVCAIGACFSAAVNRFDELRLGLTCGDSNIIQSISGPDGMKNYLGQWFIDEQLYLIEEVFEGG